MKKAAMKVVLAGTALGLFGCASLDKAPPCIGWNQKYVQVNAPERYNPAPVTQAKAAAPAKPALPATACAIPLDPQEAPKPGDCDYREKQ